MPSTILPDNLKTNEYSAEDELVKAKASTTGKKENKADFYRCV